jgi:subtilisin family serine protease
MKFVTVLTVLLFGTLAVFGQEKKSKAALYVCFDLSVEWDQTNAVTTAINEAVPGFKSIQQQYDLTLERGILISEDRLQYLESQAQKISGKSDAVQQLRNIFKVVIQNPSREKLEMIATALRRLPQVKYCNLMSQEPIKPPFDIMPVTGDFERRQTYLGANPGVNMRYAWSLGFTGQGINIKDVEYGFNKNHEEFHQTRTSYATGMVLDPLLPAEFPEHGTAVFGIVYAHKGNYGVSGMAYGAQEMVVYPEATDILGVDRVYAISESISKSRTGDVIIFEMQTYGFDGLPDPGDERFVPAEYEPVVWTLTRAATDAGIIIVAAAGNGGEDLDHLNYATYKDMGNSGAIIVGGGTPDLNHNRYPYSTYGSRVDLQGWGANVFTTGYGDVVQVANDTNQWYTSFSGTSSATPIVASCVVVLQSYYYSLTAKYMTALEMKLVLQRTGIAQGTRVPGNIGPLPDMQAAMDFLKNNSLDVTTITQDQDIKIYPNPFEAEVVLVNRDGAGAAVLELYNAVGQMVYNAHFENQIRIDTRQLQRGIYFAKLSDRNGTLTRKIVKQ